MSVRASLLRSVVVRGLWAGVAFLALTGAATVAQANPITGTFNVSIYQAATGSNNINAASQQANSSNPLITPSDLVGSGTYTGAINFILNSGSDTITAFFASGGGTLNPALATAVSGHGLSTGNFDLTTVMVFTGVATGALNGTISHDDGISLYNGPSYGNLVVGSALPTVDIPTLYALPAGPWELIYVEANGLPADLVFGSTLNFDQSTPLPGALPLFASGLGVLGLFGRRRKRKNAASLVAA